MPMGINDLNSIMSVDPAMFQSALQMRDQSMAASDLANQAATLKNQFDTENNPLLLQHQGLMNTARQLNNASQSMENNVRSSSLEQEKEARRQKFIANASDDELKTMLSDAQAMGVRAAATGDQTLIDKSERMRKASWAELDKREKADAEQKKAETMAASRETVAETAAGARKYAADQAKAAADARNAAIANKAKDNPKNAEAAAVHYQMLADTETDPNEQAKYAQLAKNYGQYSMALKNAAAGTKPDMTQFGIQTNPVQMGIGAPGPVVARPATGAGGAANQVPAISNDVFNQDAGSAPSTPARDAQQQASDIAALQRELKNPSLSAEGRRVMQAQLDATLKKAGGLPPGAVQIGTSGGKPVYQTPDGQRFIGK